MADGASAVASSPGGMTLNRRALRSTFCETSRCMEVAADDDSSRDAERPHTLRADSAPASPVDQTDSLFLQCRCRRGERVSSLRSSIRGENAPAHSSRIALWPSPLEANATARPAQGKYRPPLASCRDPCRAAAPLCSENRHVVMAASPSITTHGLLCSSGRSRRRACAGNSFA